MPDTQTPNLALVKPEVGGSNDTWGDKYNANQDKIDAAVALRALNSRFWSGTQAQYDAIAAKDPTVLYFIS